MEIPSDSEVSALLRQTARKPYDKAGREFERALEKLSYIDLKRLDSAEVARLKKLVSQMLVDKMLSYIAVHNLFEHETSIPIFAADPTVAVSWLKALVNSIHPEDTFLGEEEEKPRRTKKRNLK